MKWALLIFLLVPASSFGMDRLSAIAMIETGNNDHVVGKAGEISRYQIRKTEWRSVTSSLEYTNASLAKAVTLTLMERRLAAFKSTYHRSPTNFEYYALWNAPSQVLKGKISTVVAERCQRYANLCEKPAPAS